VRRLAAGLTVLVLALWGCAGPLEKTAKKLGDIHSGNMELRLTASTPEGQKTGFELKGPFSMPEAGGLPRADLTYTRFLGTRQDSFGFISTGDAAYMRVGRQSYRLPDERVASMRGSEEAGSRGPFSGLNFDKWVPDSEVVARGEGSKVETITGELDVVRAVNDMLGIARDYGGVDQPDIEGDDAENLRKAVRGARLTVVTGKDDRVLRSLEVTMDLGREPPEAFRRALEGVTGVNFVLELKLTEPNSKVNVEAPANPLPFDRLGR
jgi:hypothetical protein